jgi:hypothetical protein
MSGSSVRSEAMGNEQPGEKSAEISRLLQEWRAGNANTGERLIEAIYDDLRQLAHVYMRRERRDHTPQATALVHEVYLRLFAGSAVSIRDRTHLLAVAARQVRRILVNHARGLHALKRGGEASNCPSTISTHSGVNRRMCSIWTWRWSDWSNWMRARSKWWNSVFRRLERNRDGRSDAGFGRNHKARLELRSNMAAAPSCDNKPL